MDLYALICKYIQSLQNLKTKTILQYQGLITSLFEKLNLVGLTFEEQIDFVQEQLHKRKWAYSTKKNVASLISRGLKYGQQQRMILSDCKFEINAKKQVKKIECLTLREQKKIEDFIIGKKKYYQYGILISMYTGLRLGELLALKWEDVDFDNKILNVNKTAAQITNKGKTETIVNAPKTHQSIRSIPISNKLLVLLKELKRRAKGECVVSRSEKMVFNRAYQKSFEILLKTLKIKHYGFHSLRHTFATRGVEKGVDVKTLSELMGHSSPAITLARYVHPTEQQKRLAVNKICS